jgi:hypothetical protein
MSLLFTLDAILGLVVVSERVFLHISIEGEDPRVPLVSGLRPVGLLRVGGCGVASGGNAEEGGDHELERMNLLMKLGKTLPRL